IEEIRLLSRKQVTPLKNINLEELVRQLLSNLDQSTITKTGFSFFAANESLSDDLKLNIYRIIQEQINNILKHADAKNVNILIKLQGKAISIVVTDDGKGFNPNAKRKGIGISNMINRIESYNGKVKIKSSPGAGCKIAVKIPC
ncbi:MAG TPA: ATP-binding protein, partial [Ferruginibacter sp.]|nr:ATP-binding protein [Ferruginibacter sp.]